jgi:hypothetical protein
MPAFVTILSNVRPEGVASDGTAFMAGETSFPTEV